jgi:Zn-dependent metalloprotease
MKRVFYTAFTLMISVCSVLGQFKNIDHQKKSTQGPQEFKENLNLQMEPVVNRGEDIQFKINTIQYLSIDKNIKPIAFNNFGQPIAFEGLLPEGRRSAKDLVEQGKLYLEHIKVATRMSDPANEVMVIDQFIDEDQAKHIKFNQMYKGIPIFGKEIWVHASRGDVNLVNGNWVPTPKIDNIVPTLSKVEVFNLLKVQEKFPPKIFLPAFLRSETTTELVIYQTKNYEAKLAYHISTYPDGLHRWEYFVDAHTGDVIDRIENTCKFVHNVIENNSCVNEQSSLKTYEIDLTDNIPNLENLEPLNTHVVMAGQDLLGINRQVNSVESGGRRYMMDINRDMFKTTSILPNKPEGVLWTIDAFNGSPENDNFSYDHVSTNTLNWTNPAAVSSQHNMALSYEYFKNVHGRNAINGQGGNVISLINVAEKDGKSMGNAFWNGAAMFYGNGDDGFLPLARGLDVAGHEMSHGVIQSTANLIYEGESGALNESFADIFGAMIDRDDWLIGEDVVRRNAFPSGALRSLQDPHNGARKDDFGAGFQPKLYNERYLGNEDNGGVHINSGIPNYAFFLFASNSSIGKERAEKVFFRALNLYLTKSSEFIDARFATVRAAQDLYGSNAANIMSDVWTTIGVGSNNQTPVDPKDKYQQNIPVNPGQDLILFTSGTQQNIFVMDDELGLVFNPLSTISPISRPSISDDGKYVLVVDKDKKAKLITVNYDQKTKTEQTLLPSNNFRNAVVSKDGNLFAFLLDEVEPYIYVFDVSKNPAEQKFIKLINPTTAQGISTGNVEFADAMEFDHSGEFLMYDSFNKLRSPTAGEISYWDINFVRIFDRGSKRLLDTTQQQFFKLFSQLPEGISVGNATFSKNSPHIIAFDYLDENEEEYKILGANTETGDVDLIADNTDLGVPTFSKSDDIVLFNTPSFFSGSNISGVPLDESKIKAINPAPQQVRTNASYAVWFANGSRTLTGVNEAFMDGNTILIYPNPFESMVTIDISNLQVNPTSPLKLEIIDQIGRKLIQKAIPEFEEKVSLDLLELNTGVYNVKIMSENKIVTKKIVKL